MNDIQQNVVEIKTLKKKFLKQHKDGFSCRKKKCINEISRSVSAGLNVNWVMNEIIKSERIQSMTSVKENEIEQSTP